MSSSFPLVGDRVTAHIVDADTARASMRLLEYPHLEGGVFYCFAENNMVKHGVQHRKDLLYLRDKGVVVTVTVARTDADRGLVDVSYPYPSFRLDLRRAKGV